MATPQCVRFSPLPRTIEQLCKEDLSEIFSTYSFKPWVINELGFNLDKQSFGEANYEFIECDSIDAALEMSDKWKGVAITFVVESIWHNITLNLWREQDNTNICLYVAREIIWYRSDDFDEGEWLLQFLLRFVSAIDAQCCGFGRDNDYEFIYKSLEPKRMLSRLQDGSLFKIHDPVIHIISNKLISPSEINNLISKHGTYIGFQYQESILGYHVLWNF
jgi:hypothetical protein